MKNLENIPKTNFFQTPDGYFDKLPLEIQARVEKSSLKAPMPYFRYAVQYALPAVLLVVAFFIFRPTATPTAENLLASVSTEQLIAYLEESNLTTDELLDSYEFDDLSIEAIEFEVYTQFDLDSSELDFIEFELPNFISDESIN